MPELLLELISEEIPARMQSRAAADLQRLVTDGLKEAGLTLKEARAYATPRRLTLVIDGIPRKSPDVNEERKGPRVGAPEKAIQGFLKAAGLESLDDCQTREDNKGEFYVAVIERMGKPAGDVIAGIVPQAVQKFPWPKSMRWGSGKLRWVRPLHSVLCLFDGKTVKFAVDGIQSGNETRGHRFLAQKPFKVKNFEDYREKLRAAKVILDGQERAEIILKEARKLAGAKKLKLVEDEALLVENAGLVEWPVVLMGEFDKPFLDVPPEVLTSAMKAHQKCFSVTGGGGKLANRFLLVSNLIAKDGGKAITAGNERVIRARLADAKFFWDQDRKKKLDDLLPKLEGVIFHEKLGTQAERVERIKRLARDLAPIVGADPDKAERAAELCKADLVTQMVGEFPDLQGLMGRYYALAQGEPPEVAEAIAEHYKPQGPNDAVPVEPVSVAVALADKLDTLVGFWAIDEKPTGSKDPYALRRAVLGVIRILLENELRASLLELINLSAFEHARKDFKLLKEIGALENLSASQFREWLEHRGHFWPRVMNAQTGITTQIAGLFLEFPRISFSRRNCEWAFRKTRAFQSMPRSSDADRDLLLFFTDRLKVYLREQGARHDLIDAVISPGAGGPVSTSPLRGEVGARSASGGGGATGAEPDAVPPSLALPHKGGGDTHEGGGGKDGGEPAVFQDDLLMIVKRVEALGNFLDSDDGANLLIGVKRAANILRIEEKKDKTSYDGTADVALLKEKEEKALHKAIGEVTRAAGKCIEKEDFEGAMAALARLRAPVDAFFDHVTVNADDKDLRSNRLALLSEIRRATLKVADFSKIEG